MTAALFHDKVLDERFQCLGTLGEGGMGIIYRVRDRRLDRESALKVMRLEVRADDDTALKRFHREAKVLEQLRHPQIVSIQSFGVSERGDPFFVMDLLKGKSLDAYVDEAALSLERFFDVFLQVCVPLAFAHEQGVVHRDIKTSNIFVCDDGVVKLLDFGLAKATLSLNQGLTQPGDILGSPPYMAPELFEMKDADSRSDIYSLGCVMYETLCGKPPFVALSLPGYAMAHLGSPPVPLASVMRIPSGVSALVDSLLQKNPAARPASVALVSDYLRALKVAPDVRVTESSPPKKMRIDGTSTERLTKIPSSAYSEAGAESGRRRPANILFFAMIFGVIVVGAAAFQMLYCGDNRYAHELEHSLIAYQKQPDAAHAKSLSDLVLQAEAGGRVSQDTVVRFQEAADTYFNRKEYAVARELYDDGVILAKVAPPLAPAERALMLQNLAGCYAALANSDSLVRVPFGRVAAMRFREALMLEQKGQNLKPSREFLAADAVYDVQWGELSLADKDMTLALRSFAAARDQPPVLFIMKMGEIKFRLGKYAEARRYLDTAIKRLGESDAFLKYPFVAEQYCANEMALGHPELANAMQERQLPFIQKLDRASLANFYFSRASCLAELKRLPESALLFRQSLATKTFEAGSERWIDANRRLGSVLLQMGKKTEARAYLTAALAAIKKSPEINSKWLQETEEMLRACQTS